MSGDDMTVEQAGKLIRQMVIIAANERPQGAAKAIACVNGLLRRLADAETKLVEAEVHVRKAYLDGYAAGDHDNRFTMSRTAEQAWEVYSHENSGKGEDTPTAADDLARWKASVGDGDVKAGALCCSQCGMPPILSVEDRGLGRPHQPGDHCDYGFHPDMDCDGVYELNLSGSGVRCIACGLAIPDRPDGSLAGKAWEDGLVCDRCGDAP